MATYTEQMQKIWRLYEEDGQPLPATARDVAAWAVRNKLWVPQPADVIAQCAEDLSRALREEYHKDKRGRRVRSKHAVRVNQGGKQITLWADMKTAPRKHMEMAFSQRRQQIVGDCVQLSRDVASYNEEHADQQPIQLVLDFTDDVREAEFGDEAAA
ncbi:hypothetical protein [Telmatospirillum sp. J64-1]|uniref:hypothetical protein n=1 Tax=Telmatospirillum sp. J64-1 TaxID=2502183 RepID=UPI00115CF13B|nr:hypothetical protein [Telmatospirillum sp. J64-1]